MLSGDKCKESADRLFELNVRCSQIIFSKWRENQKLIKAAKIELRSVFKHEFDLNAFQVRQGK